MDQESVDILRTLFTSVESGETELDTDEPVLRVGLRETGLLFRGDALHLLRQLQERLAVAALGSDSHIHSDEVRQLAIEACRRAQSAGEDAAVAWFQGALLRSPKTVWIGVPIAAHFTGDALDLGRCRLIRELPAAAKADVFASADAFRDRQVLATEVKARDPISAEIRARDALDEGISLLRLVADEPSEHPVGTHCWIREEQPGFAYRSSDMWFVRRAGSEGTLWPPYRDLARSMAVSAAEQTEWERRAIAACRWYNRAMSAGWPSVSLAACFTALECLLVRGRQEPEKGAKVAERVTRHRARVRGLDEDELRQWIIDLYRRRNDTVHEGVAYADEIEIARLEELTRAATHWAATHLDRHHRLAGVCSSFDDVHDGDHEP